MLDMLKIVQGAVSKKDFIPTMKAVHFYNNRVQSTNGNLTIDVPFPLDLNVTVDAGKLIKAIEACQEEPLFNVTDKSLIIKSGKFRVQLPRFKCEEFPQLNIKGFEFSPCPEFLERAKIVRPFIGRDASKPWACGMLIKNSHLLATNNTSIIKCKLINQIPAGFEVNLPAFTVDELIRIKMAPESICIQENAVAFKLPGDIWIRSTLFSIEWPDVSSFFNEQSVTPIIETLAKSIESLIPFCENEKYPIIEFGENGLSTIEGNTRAEIEGISFPTLKLDPRVFLPILAVASHVNFAYPKTIFSGLNGDLQGVIMSIRCNES